MTTFKTLSARLRGSTTELKELDEETDEYTETTSKLRDLVKGLTGFDIMEDENNFKDIYEILVGIGKEWDNLTDIEQASLSEALAGKRMSNALFAILNNIDTLEEAYKTAEESAGSARREEEHYEESVQYRIDQTKASLQELSYDFLSSDFLKGLIEGANIFLQKLDEIVEKVGTLGSLIAAFTAKDFFMGAAGGNSIFAEIFKTAVGPNGDTGTMIGNIKKLISGKENKDVSNAAKAAGNVAGEALSQGVADGVKDGAAEKVTEDVVKSVAEGATDAVTENVAESGVKNVVEAVTKTASEVADDIVDGAEDILAKAVVNESTEATMSKMAKPLAEGVIDTLETTFDDGDAGIILANSLINTESISEVADDVAEVAEKTYATYADKLADIAKDGPIFKDAERTLAKGAAEAGEVAGEAMAGGMASGASSAAGGLGSKLVAALGGPVGAAIAGVATAALVGLAIATAVKRSREKAVEEATQEAMDLATRQSDMDSTIARVEELRNKLKDSNITEEEAYNTKIELLSIQEQLSDSYGNLSGQIDLVNGSLKEQIGLMQQASVYDANKFLNENDKAIKIATKEMTKEINDSLSQEISMYDPAFDKVKEIVDKYDSFKLTPTQDGLYRLDITGNVQEVDSQIVNLMADLRELRDESGSYVVDMMYDGLEGYNNHYQDVIDKNQALYKKGLENSLLVNGFDDSGNLKEDSGLKYLNDLTAAADTLNDSIIGVNDISVDEALTGYKNAWIAAQGFLKDSPQYSVLFDEVAESANTSNVSLAKFKENVNDSDSRLGKFAKDVKDSKLSESDIFDILYGKTTNVGSGSDAILALAKSFGILKGDVAPTEAQITSFVDVLKDLGVIASDVAEDGTIDLSDFFKEASTAVAQVDKMNAALVSGLQSGGMSISYEVGENGEESWTGTIEDVRKAFGELESFNINGLLKRTSNGVKVNQKAWRKLRQEQENLQKKKFLEKQADLTAQLTDLQTQLIAAQAKGEDTGNLQKRISDLQENIDNVNFLAAAYDGATSAYQKWLDVQAGPKEGDIYDNIRDNALTRGDELLKNGMVGDEFRSIAQMFSSEDLSTAPLEQVIEAYQAIDKIVPGTTKKVRDFFTEDMQGAFAFSDALVELGYATGSSTEGYEFGLFTTEEIAKSLGVSQDIVDAIFDKMRLFGADVTLLSDDEVEKLKAAGKNVDELQDKLENLNKEQKVTKDSSELDISVATNFNLDELNTVDELQGKIDELNTLRANPNISDESAKILDSILAEVIKKLDIINGTDANPDVVTLDDVIQAQEQLENLKRRLAEIREYNNTHVNVQLSAQEDPTVQSLAEYIAGLDEGLQLDLGIDESNIDDVEGIIDQLLNGDITIEDVVGIEEAVQKKLDGMNPTVEVEPKVNNGGMNNPDTLIQEKFATKGTTTTNTVTTKTTGQEDVDSLSSSINNVNDKKVNVEAKVKGTGTVIALDRSIDSVNSKSVEVTAQVHGTGTVIALAQSINSLRDKTITITTIRNNRTDPHFADGTAHAEGTTYAHGKWGAPRTETALVNELGPEIIVRDGRWFTANDGKPGFTGIKKGDIIFNHKQSEELLKNGYVTKGYAHMAFAEGSAFANVGKWGSYFTQQQYNGGGNTTNVVQQAAVNASKAVQKAADKVKDDVDKTIDWIEILMDRIDRRIEDLANAAEDVWMTFSYRRSNLYEEIDVLRQQESYAKQGANRYLKEANSVGLPADLKQLVQKGKIDISSVKTEELKKKVEEYQGWYDKYLDMINVMEEAQYNLKQAFSDNYDLVQTEYEGLLGNLEHSINTMQNFIDIVEEDGHFSSSKYYTEMIKSEEENINVLKSEKEDLSAALDEALKNGLKVGSEEWVRMTQGIQECDEAIQESTKNIITYNNSIRDLKWQIWEFLQERISDVNTELEFLYDLIDEDKMFDEKGLVTFEGMDAFALLAEQMNVYMAQAEKYADMIKQTEKDLAKDPYDIDLIEKLAELRKAQQDSIISANDQKKAIRDLVKNGYDKMGESLQKIINEYTELMDNNKDMYDYQKNLIEQQKEINRLQRQMQAWGSDTSEEGAARRQQTSVELEEAQQELYETQEDRRISETKAALNDLYDNFNEVINTRLDDIEAVVTQVVNAVNVVASGTNAIHDAVTGISGVSTNILDLNGVLTAAKDELLGNEENIILKKIGASASYVGYDITKDVKTALGAETTLLDGIRNIVTNFSLGKFTVSDAAVLTAVNGISTLVSKMVAASDEKAKKDIKNTTTPTKKKSTPKPTTPKPTKKPTTPKPTKKPTTAKKSSAPALTGDIKNHVAAAIWNGGYGWGFGADREKKLNEVFGSGNGIQALVNAGVGATGISPAGYSYAAMRKKFRGYASGGKNLKDQLAWLDEFGRNETIIRKSDGAVLTRLNLGDSVLKKIASDNLWNMANDPTQFIKDNMPTNTKVSNIGGGTQNNSFDISINVPNVTNYREFMFAMQKDKQFERLIQEMTLGQMNGNNSLRKHSINIR